MCVHKYLCIYASMHTHDTHGSKIESKNSNQIKLQRYLKIQLYLKIQTVFILSTFPCFQNAALFLRHRWWFKSEMSPPSWLRIITLAFLFLCKDRISRIFDKYCSRFLSFLPSLKTCIMHRLFQLYIQGKMFCKKKLPNCDVVFIS